MIGKTNVGGGENKNVPPEFTYTGTYLLLDDSETTGNKGDWRIKFTSSGTLNFTKLGKGNGTIDIFCLGAGGSQKGNPGCGGSGGGYTRTLSNTIVLANTDYAITIGNSVSASTGQASSFSDKLSASGGVNNAGTNNYWGGNGGSGGGAGAGESCSAGSGGSDGGNGGNKSGGSVGGPGYGQGTTTREFGESDGTLYAGGGAGVPYNQGSAGGGGAGGGGGANSSAGANTGGGAGGSMWQSYTGRTGGSGIVVIRNHRS